MMKWFTGNVQSAIKKALDERKIFIVYIQGKDDNSKKMDETWDNEKVATCCTDENCVAIRITEGSIEVEQFSKCYPVLCIPSTYFINQSGVPIDIVAGFLESENFLQRLEVILKQEDLPNATNVQGPIEAPANDNSHNDLSKSTQIKHHQDANLPEESEADIKKRVENAKDLMQRRREEREKQERQEKIEKEKKRREEQRNMEMARLKQKEEDTKKLVRERAIDKANAKAAREDILKKIQQDKLEKATRYQEQQEKEKLEIENRRKARDQLLAKNQEKASSERLTSRIQFRLPDGSTLNREYPSSITLNKVMESFVQETKPRFDCVHFGTLYPKRQFDASEMDLTIKELNLVPSAVLIVIPQRQAAKVTSTNGVLDFLLFVLTPIISLLTFVKALIFGDASSNERSSKDQNGPQTNNTNNAATTTKVNTKSSGTQGVPSYERTGNVYKFRQDQEDDDDEKKTWNGNSTQQM